jgi:hypothetical protein
MGMIPDISEDTRITSMSIPITLCPRLESPTADVSPTYPSPTTAICAKSTPVYTNFNLYIYKVIGFLILLE